MTDDPGGSGGDSTEPRGAGEGATTGDEGRPGRESIDDLLDVLPTAAVVLSAAGEVVRTNERADALLGGEGRRWVRDLAVYDEAGAPVPDGERPHALAAETGEPVYGWPCRVALPDGGERWLSVNAAPMGDGDGPIQRVVVTMEDTTHVGEAAGGRPAAQEEATEASERRYRTMIDNLPNMAVSTYDDDLRYVTAGGENLERLDRPAGDLAGRRIPEVLPTDLAEELVPRYRAAVERGETREFELGYRGRHYLFRAVPVRDAGDDLAAMAVSQDVTERKRFEDRLRTLHASARELPGVVLYRHDPGREELFPAVESADAGFIRDELLTVPADGSSLVGRAFVEGETLRFDDVRDSPHLASDPDELGMRAGLFVPIGDHGVLVAASEAEADFTDRTEQLLEVVAANAEATYGRVERDRALAESRERYRALVDNFPNGLVGLFDGDLRYSIVGGRIFDDLEVDPRTLVDRTVDDVFGDDPAVRDAVRANFEAALAGEERMFDVEYADRDWLVHAVPVTEDDGVPFAGMVIGQDVTRRRAHERELERRIGQQRVVTELGGMALAEGAIDDLFEAAVERVAETLDADYCKVLDLDEETDHLRLRAGVGWREGLVGEATVGFERDSQAGYTLLTDDPVVVADLAAEERFSGPELLTSHDVCSGMSVVIGPVDEPWGVLGVHDRERREFTDSDASFLQSVATILGTAIRRVDRERDLEKYEAIVESVSDGVYTIDGDGRFSMVNEAYAAMTGYDRAALLGARASMVVDDEVIQRARELEGELLAGERDSATLEAELQTADGGTLPAEATFAILPDPGGDVERIGVVRDVSERKRFEETLRGLYDTSRELFRATTVDGVSERIVAVAVDVLDLPGVAVYLRDETGERLVPAVQSAGEVFVRDELPSLPADEANVVGRVYRSGAAERLDDVRESPQFGEDVDEPRAGVFAPMGDHGVVVVEAREAGDVDYRASQLVELLAANAEVAYDRVERERAIERQRERLAALNDLNGVVREINGALVDRDRKEEVERAVVERLADSGSYAFAWIGGVDRARGEVTLRAEAGVDGYLDDLTVELDPEGPPGPGPTALAVTTGEMQVVSDARNDADYRPWHDRAVEYGYRSSAAIPISYEGTLYGVLNVYADRRNAFTGEEREVVGQLGVIVGHALNAIERKEALVSDEVVEVEFTVQGFFDQLGSEWVEPGRIEYRRAVPVGDGEYVVYGTASEESVDALDALVERQPHWEGYSITGTRQDDVRFELHLSEPPVMTVVASQGGRIRRATLEDGDFRLVVQLPPGADVRSIVESVQGSHPDAEVLAQRRTHRSTGPPASVDQVFEARLTPKQRSALEAAYFSGFFEWPRDSSGEDVAGTLGVSAPTFHEHLRTGQRALLDAVFEGGSGTG